MGGRTLPTACHPTIGNHVRRYLASNPFAVTIGKAPIPAFVAMVIFRVGAIVNSNVIGINDDHDACGAGHYCLG